MSSGSVLQPAILFLFVATLSVTDAKVETGVFALKSWATEHFITKFSFTQGDVGTVQMAFGGHGQHYLDGYQHQLMVAVYNDEDWERYLEAGRKGSLCSERMMLASLRIPLQVYSKGGPIVKDLPGAKESFEFQVNEQIPMPEAARSHYFFFVLADCSLEFYDAHPPDLDFSIHVRNGKSELPAFESGVMFVYLTGTLVLGAVCFVALKYLLLQYRRYNQVHAAAAVTVAALVLQTIAALFETIHLVTYANDGKGFRLRHGRLPLDMMSDVFTTLSESLVIVLVVAFAHGWTVLDGSRTRLKTLGMASIFMVFLQLALELYSRRYEDDFSTFHDHDHWPGTLLMCCRMMAALMVVLGSRRVIATAGNESHKTILFNVAALGTFWLLVFPLQVLIISPMTPITARHAVVVASTLFLQTVALTTLSAMFLGIGGIGSIFFKSSTIAAMGDLDAASSTDDKSKLASLRRKVAVD